MSTPETEKVALMAALLVQLEVNHATSLLPGTLAPVSTPQEFWAVDQLAVSLVLPPAEPTQ